MHTRQGEWQVLSIQGNTKIYQPLKKINLEAVMFGKNIVAYVALEDIEEESELFLDYGRDYDPEQLLRIPGMMIKQEGV